MLLTDLISFDSRHLYFCIIQRRVKQINQCNGSIILLIIILIDNTDTFLCKQRYETNSATNFDPNIIILTRI